MIDTRGAVRCGLLLALVLWGAACGPLGAPAAEPPATALPLAPLATITPRNQGIPGDVATIYALESVVPGTPASISTSAPTLAAVSTPLPTATETGTPTNVPTPTPTVTPRPLPTATQAPRTIGKAGSGDGEFAYPTGIAVTSDAIYVVDRDNNRIERFTPQGDFVWKAGGAGRNPGQLSVPSGIALLNKLLYVADSGNKRIAVFNADTGSFVRVFGERGSDFNQLGGPYGVAFDTTGHLFVSDKGNFRVQVYNPDDSPLRMSGSGGGKLGEFAGMGPGGVAVDGNNVLFAADTSRDLVDMFDWQGKYLKYLGGSGVAPGALKAPVGVAVDSSGRVIVADRDNRRVSIFSGDGKFIGVKPVGDGTEPTFVAVDPVGMIYVTDVKNNQVVVLP